MLAPRDYNEECANSLRMVRVGWPILFLWFPQRGDSPGWDRAAGDDCKGNDVTRQTLGGTRSFTYGWGTYDRLTESNDGTTLVRYEYDAMGRLLRHPPPPPR